MEAAQASKSESHNAMDCVFAPKGDEAAKRVLAWAIGTRFVRSIESGDGGAVRSMYGEGSTRAAWVEFREGRV
jgi:hypothetical protein